jgi:hypothetical protein
MIRIPTGSVPKNTARTLTLLLGLGALGVSFIPALAPFATALRELGLAASGLGTTLGKQ